MKPEIGSYYEHFKGNVYRVEGFATHSETQEDLILYKSVLKSSVTWARPANMWFDHITRDNYQGPRFKGIKYEDKN